MSLDRHAATTEDHALAAAMGDSDALSFLFERLEQKLYNHLLRITGCNADLAEELSQRTWENVARSVRKYETKRGGFEAWLFTIARNEHRKFYRWTTRHPEQLTGEMVTIDRPDTGASVEDLVDRRLLQHRLAAEVSGLCKQQREVISYRFVAGLDLAETANVMGTNVNNVKQLQHRALRTLRQRLGDDVELLAGAQAPEKSAVRRRVIAPPRGGKITLTGTAATGGTV